MVIGYQLAVRKVCVATLEKYLNGLQMADMTRSHCSPWIKPEVVKLVVEFVVVWRLLLGYEQNGISSSPAPAFALPLPYSCTALFKLLSGRLLAPPQFLPCSCPLSALLCSTLLSSVPALFLPCSCPAHTSAPLLLCSSSAPALLLVLPIPVWKPSLSSSAPYHFFWDGESRLLW